MTGAGGRIRVLVVDDSAFMRRVIADLLGSDPAIEVVGVARDGEEAVAKAAALAPDVVTLDVEMPRMDGLEALRRIMATAPCPVVMVSSLTRHGADVTVRALALGAVDFVPKPSGPVSLDLHRVRDELVRKVKVAARVPRERLRGLAPGGPVRPGAGGGAPGAAGSARLGGRGLTAAVVVAASTGGPGALYRLLGGLPGDLRAGVLVIQHMPAGFTRSLAAHLDQVSGLAVREAAEGDRLEDGVALVAPGGFHLRVRPDGTVELDQGPPRHGVRPAADVTMESLPEGLARRTVALVLTGMGMDGARGAKYLKDRGAEVWIQDEASCVVYGMPRAVAELGVADRAGPPEQLAAWLRERLGGGS